MRYFVIFAFLIGVSIPFHAHAQSKSKLTTTQALNQNVLKEIEQEKKSKKWGFIVIHHTASEWSSMKRIDRYHRKKFKDPDGIEYHFLIGNGKKAKKGLIEVGRWKIQKRAIHLFKPEGAPRAIAISLVGNFHKRKIQKYQYRALLSLVKALMLRHTIPIENITTHTRVDGNLTVCPGKHFPFRRLVQDLKKKGTKK